MRQAKMVSPRFPPIEPSYAYSPIHGAAPHRETPFNSPFGPRRTAGAAVGSGLSLLFRPLARGRNAGARAGVAPRHLGQRRRARQSSKQGPRTRIADGGTPTFLCTGRQQHRIQPAETPHQIEGSLRDNQSAALRIKDWRHRYVTRRREGDGNVHDGRREGRQVVALSLFRVAAPDATLTYID